ncbi:MAG TPA: CocE/NonD family hydrolase [Solirubrobacteraceae bacterium]|nr:CocE/NonD family hydrolase [Solirubrobacteraceae bacterium]
MPAALAATAALLLPAGTPVARASGSPIQSIFAGQTVSGAAIPCTTQSDGTRVCYGTYDNGAGDTDLRLKSFDGTPLALYVTLPPAPASGADGPYPLIIQSHGWDEPTTGPNDTQYYGPTADAWAKAGYAVLQLTARGFGDSCGDSASRAADPTGCADGYIRLDDERYEAHDAQYAAGLLVDEGVADPNHIGATGESYGGGLSLELATLNNRVMNTNGTLSPWTSPDGTPLHIAAAAPVIPWSDLAYSLVPNGHTLDYQTTTATADLSPIGVEKQSFVSGLYAEGNENGYYAPAGTNSQADLTTWYAELNAGEPYDGNAQDEALVTQIAEYHSPYYLLDGAYGFGQTAPAPLLIANGFTDDLFPVDEALRYYNLEHSLYPSDPISLFDGDFGHQPANNKPGDLALLSNAIQNYFAYYLKGAGSQPAPSATATIETCPATEPSGGPYTAPTWSALHPGEVDYSSAPAQAISSAAGDPTISKEIDPIVGGGACATVPSADQGSGVATYRLPAATGSGYTLLGSPTVIANLNVTGEYAFIAARLWDVDPSTNTQTLVARGVYRIDSSAPDGLQVFQLHPGAWHFAAGHIPKLELLGQDTPYVRTSNGQFTISVSDLQLRLPVHEAPGTAPGVVAPRPPVTARAHGCLAMPHSKITRRRTHASRHGVSVSGTAGEYRCPNAPAANRKKQRLAHVYVMIYRTAAHGRCRFVQRNGKLSRPRSCLRPIEFRARGTSRWTLRLTVPLPAGRYTIRSDAVDRLHHHQLRSAASAVLVTIR